MSDSAEMNAALNLRGEGMLPGHMGLQFEMQPDRSMKAWFDVEGFHHAPNGFLHAGSIVTLADTACGYGCFMNLPEGAVGFTTVELKSNFVGTTRQGRVETHARMLHSGRTTQLWDAVVTHVGKPIAYFRCTQMILYPKPGAA